MRTWHVTYLAEDGTYYTEVGATTEDVARRRAWWTLTRIHGWGRVQVTDVQPVEDEEDEPPDLFESLYGRSTVWPGD